MAEKKYIELEAAIKLCTFGRTSLGLVGELRRLPAADVRPVVLCKDCKNWDTDWVPKYAKENEYFCPIVTLTTRDDWFCADGEKREENNG